MGNCSEALKTAHEIPEQYTIEQVDQQCVMRQLPGFMVREMQYKVPESPQLSPRLLMSPRESNPPDTPASMAHSVAWEKLWLGNDSFETVSQEQTDQHSLEILECNESNGDSIFTQGTEKQFPTQTSSNLSQPTFSSADVHEDISGSNNTQQELEVLSQEWKPILVIPRHMVYYDSSARSPVSNSSRSNLQSISGLPSVGGTEENDFFPQMVFGDLKVEYGLNTNDLDVIALHNYSPAKRDRSVSIH